MNTTFNLSQKPDPLHLRSGSLRSPALRHRRARKGQLPCTNSHKGWTGESDPVNGTNPTLIVLYQRSGAGQLDVYLWKSAL